MDFWQEFLIGTDGGPILPQGNGKQKRWADFFPPFSPSLRFPEGAPHRCYESCSHAARWPTGNEALPPPRAQGCETLAGISAWAAFLHCDPKRQDHPKIDPRLSPPRPESTSHPPPRGGSAKGLDSMARTGIGDRFPNASLWLVFVFFLHLLIFLRSPFLHISRSRSSFPSPLPARSGESPTLSRRYAGAPVQLARHGGSYLREPDRYWGGHQCAVPSTQIKFEFEPQSFVARPVGSAAWHGL